MIAESPRDGGQPTSRFERLGRRPASIVLLATVLLIALGVLMGGASTDRHAHERKNNEGNVLYKAIIERVQHGDNYYDAAVTEQRRRGYPLHPVVTVREPALAVVSAVVGGERRIQMLLFGVGAVTGLALLLRLEKIAPGRSSWWMSFILSAIAGLGLFVSGSGLVHDVWAGVLLLLALLLSSAGKWRSAVIVGTLAALVRELCFPFMVVMAFFAWRDGRRAEFRAWLIGMAVFLVGYGLHAWQVLEHTDASDPTSPGWVKIGGWPFALSSVRETTILNFFPAWVPAVLVPIALLGWASRSDPFSRRVFALIASYLAAFTLVGQDGNWYWGYLIILPLGAGLAFSPSAVRSLNRAIRRPSLSTG